MNENDAIIALKELLSTKLDLFLSYERLTDKLLICDADDMVGVVEQRQNLSAEVDMVDSKLNELYTLSGNGLLKDAAMNKLAFGECPKPLEEIFLSGQRIFSVISAIMRKEEQIVSRVEDLRDEALAQIKEQNSGTASKAAKYYSVSKELGQKISLFDNKY